MHDLAFAVLDVVHPLTPEFLETPLEPRERVANFFDGRRLRMIHRAVVILDRVLDCLVLDVFGHVLAAVGDDLRFVLVLVFVVIFEDLDGDAAVLAFDLVVEGLNVDALLLAVVALDNRERLFHRVVRAEFRGLHDDLDNGADNFARLAAERVALEFAGHRDGTNAVADFEFSFGHCLSTHGSITPNPIKLW